MEVGEWKLGVIVSWKIGGGDGLFFFHLLFIVTIVVVRPYKHLTQKWHCLIGTSQSTPTSKSKSSNNKSSSSVGVKAIMINIEGCSTK